jgi:hypothetical protein
LPQMQVSQDHAVTYYGRTLSKIERNNCMTWHELLAIVKMLEHFSM